jgi:hypothetical protein
MTMENKALIYTVLAISLGYLLVSAVPSRLAPPMYAGSGDDSELIRGPVPESAVPPEEGAATAAADSTQGDTLSSESAQGERLSAGSGSRNMIVSVFGTWSVNLLIALGVYFFARRRFA